MLSRGENKYFIAHRPGFGLEDVSPANGNLGWPAWGESESASDEKYAALC